MARKRLTVADIAALKGKRQLTMLRIFTLDEAAAAEAAGIDVVSLPTDLVTHPRYREVAPSLFSMTGATHLEAGTREDYLRRAPFEDVPDLVLFDFGVHWFDFVTSITGKLANRAQAQAVYAPAAGVKPAMLASALLDFGTAQASLTFDAATPFGAQDTTYIAGTKGSLISRGPDLGRQQVELYTEAGVARPMLSGHWFNDGFAGTMGELLCAIEEGREPENSAEGNLLSLANCFAALKAASTGEPQPPGQVRQR